MIEGLRVAPSYFDAQREHRVPRTCEECKSTVTMETRQARGCGYEPAVEFARPWVPPAWREHRADLTLSVCPGYSTTLPAVAQALHAYPQWEMGTLGEYLGGPATDGCLDCLAALRDGIRELEAHKMANVGKGKG